MKYIKRAEFDIASVERLEFDIDILSISRASFRIFSLSHFSD